MVPRKHIFKIFLLILKQRFQICIRTSWKSVSSLLIVDSGWWTHYCHYHKGPPVSSGLSHFKEHYLYRYVIRSLFSLLFSVTDIIIATNQYWQWKVFTLTVWVTDIFCWKHINFFHNKMMLWKCLLSPSIHDLEKLQEMFPLYYMFYMHYDVLISSTNIMLYQFLKG